MSNNNSDPITAKAGYVQLQSNLTSSLNFDLVVLGRGVLLCPLNGSKLSYHGAMILTVRIKQQQYYQSALTYGAPKTSP